MHRYFFVEDGEARDINGRYGSCLFLNIRIKGNQPFYTAEIEIAVAAFYRRLVIELIAAQAVVYGEDTDFFRFGFKADQSPVGPEP